jgi:DNA-binding NtrC family response regulator
VRPTPFLEEIDGYRPRFYLIVLAVPEVPSLNREKGEQLDNSHRGTRETILVVDDAKAVREVLVKFLEVANFKVLSADSGASAIKLARETDDRIDLLLSEVDMGKMSGPDLGEILKKDRPDLHVMLMSGGKDGNLLLLNYGWAFIRKPFVGAKLIEMVTDVLHSENRSQPGGQGFDSRKEIKNPNSEERKRAEADIHPPTRNEPKDRGTE